jgi:uncharacterized protein (DUF2062 family)/SAM-dependent methyltransferase
MSTAVPSRRRPRRHPFAKAYYRLRTRRDSPRQKALAVLLGVTVGCTPLFGLHLPMCIVLARITGLSGVTAYLASYANNPLVAPFTLYLSLGIGRWLFTGDWPRLRLDYGHAAGVWDLGRDMLIGSVVVGLILGGALASIVYRFSSRHEERQLLAPRLSEAAARRYLDTGILNWEFVRGKLKHDPLYLGLLKHNILPREGRLLDLGCGRGILLAMLENARRLHASGEWQSDWPRPPQLALSGVDARSGNVRIACRALGGGAEILAADLQAYQPPPCEVVALLDVLHYLPPEHQQGLIGRIGGALRPHGLLLIREADATRGLRFTITRLAERLCALCRGDWRHRYHYRGLREWTRLLESQGFTVKTRLMSKGTPFANVLIEARNA